MDDDMAGVLIGLSALRAMTPRPDPTLLKPATLPGLGALLPERAELTLQVGHGIAGIILGVSTVEDVLARYGADCSCSCIGAGAIPGDSARGREDLRVWRISYAYDLDGEHRPGRPRNHTRPRGYRVDSETRRVQVIEVGTYQKQLRTAEGLGAYSRLADLLELYGPPERATVGDERDTYEYDRGMRVGVDRESEEVIVIELYRPRR